MDDPGGMGRSERIGDLDGVAERLGDRPPASRQAPRQGRAGHVLHDDEVAAAVAADVVDRDDVRVIEGAGGLRLLREAPLAVRVDDLVGRQHLDGDGATQLRIAGAVHDAHTTLAKGRIEEVASECQRRHRATSQGILARIARHAVGLARRPPRLILVPPIPQRRVVRQARLSYSGRRSRTPPVNEDKSTRYHRRRRRADAAGTALVGIFLLVLSASGASALFRTAAEWVASWLPWPLAPSAAVALFAGGWRSRST